MSPSFIRYKGQVKFFRFTVSLKTVYTRDDNRENNKSNAHKLDLSVVFKSVDALSVDYKRVTSEGS
jgi:hypothetical protein